MSAGKDGKSVQVGRLILEVRQCALCLDPVVYWRGSFRHLTALCPASPAPLVPDGGGNLERAVGELDSYLPAAVQNQALLADGPAGPGTLKGFHAKVAEVFQLGESVGWDKAVAHWAVE